MKIEKARAARRLRVSVGHGHRARFLERQDIFDGRRAQQRIHERKLRRAGIAEYVFNAFARQNLEQDVCSSPRILRLGLDEYPVHLLVLMSRTCS